MKRMSKGQCWFVANMLRLGDVRREHRFMVSVDGHGQWTVLVVALGSRGRS